MLRDDRVDAAIAAAQPFARPILEELRAAVHGACPDAAETIKWGRPFFTIDGRPLAFMAAFKAHAAFGFWQSRDTGRGSEAAGQFGKLTTLADLPMRRELVAMIRAAADRAAGPGQPGKARTERLETALPADFTAALARDVEANATFGRLAPSYRREYAAWISGAKREATRTRRIEKALALLADGKDMSGIRRIRQEPR